MAGKGVAGFAPPGWPQDVPGPGSPFWVEPATAWLLDHAPAEWRLSRGFRRHPVALAWATREHLRAQLSAARAAWVDLPGAGASAAEEELVRTALKGSGPGLAAAVRASELLYEALRGSRFIPRL